MSTDNPETAAQRAFGEFAPKLVELDRQGLVWRPVGTPGWPNAISAITRAKQLFDKTEP